MKILVQLVMFSVLIVTSCTRDSKTVENDSNDQILCSAFTKSDFLSLCNDSDQIKIGDFNDRFNFAFKRRVYMAGEPFYFNYLDHGALDFIGDRESLDSCRWILALNDESRYVWVRFNDTPFRSQGQVVYFDYRNKIDSALSRFVLVNRLDDGYLIKMNNPLQSDYFECKLYDLKKELYYLCSNSTLPLFISNDNFNENMFSYGSLVCVDSKGKERAFDFDLKEKNVISYFTRIK